MPSKNYGAGRECSVCGGELSPFAKSMCGKCKAAGNQGGDVYPQEFSRPALRDRVEYLRGRAAQGLSLFDDGSAPPPINGRLPYHWPQGRNSVPGKRKRAQ